MQQEEESNLVKARSSILWIVALLVAFGAVALIERYSKVPVVAPVAVPAAAPADPLAPTPGQPPLPAPRALTEQERAWAKTAWVYFEKNTDAATGLAGSVEGFTGTTMWDAGSTLLALLAARELDLVDARTFDERLGRALDSLARLPLYANALPNKAYDVRQLQLTDYANQPAPAGIGWSAIDLGRLVVPLEAIAWQHPQHTAKARAVIARWDLSRLASGGRLLGMQAAGQSTQEGRLGYEQYAARALATLGLDLDEAVQWDKHLKLETVQGVPVPVDDRDPARFGAQNYVTSEPYMLLGLEFGWGRRAREAAWRVYSAQEARFRATGKLTAVTEDHFDREPRFAYNAVYSGGRSWVAVTDKGEDATALRTLSVKAAFAWHALLRTEYTGKLLDAVAPLNDPQRGWFAGLYEEGQAPNKALSANTNAVVLESLAYIQRGPLLKVR